MTSPQYTLLTEYARRLAAQEHQLGSWGVKLSLPTYWVFLPYEDAVYRRDGSRWGEDSQP